MIFLVYFLYISQRIYLRYQRYTLRCISSVDRSFRLNNSKKSQRTKLRRETCLLDNVYLKYNEESHIAAPFPVEIIRGAKCNRRKVI